jgi:hypothetical protein
MILSVSIGVRPRPFFRKRIFMSHRSPLTMQIPKSAQSAQSVDSYPRPIITMRNL